ncbi:MAG: hypothetical protein Q4B40_06275, partial [Clostridia bacterium]|nr:hypothetical protein [Clostridia bacterium]
MRNKILKIIFIVILLVLQIVLIDRTLFYEYYYSLLNIALSILYLCSLMILAFLFSNKKGFIITYNVLSVSAIAISILSRFPEFNAYFILILSIIPTWLCVPFSPLTLPITEHLNISDDIGFF